MTVEEALAEIRASVETGRNCVVGFAQSIAQTGEPYVTISVGGVVAEGEMHPFEDTGEAAAAGLLKSLRAYAEEVDPAGSGTLYWRIYPELERQTHGYSLETLRRYKYPKPRFFGYARLLISSKPVVPAIVEAYEAALADRESDQALAEKARAA